MRNSQGQFIKGYRKGQRKYQFECSCGNMVKTSNKNKKYCSRECYSSNHKKGWHHSDETKMKMRQKGLGRMMSKISRKKMSEFRNMLNHMFRHIIPNIPTNMTTNMTPSNRLKQVICQMGVGDKN